MCLCMLFTTSGKRLSKEMPLVEPLRLRIRDALFFHDCTQSLLRQLLSALLQDPVLLIGLVGVDLNLCLHILGTLDQLGVGLAEVTDGRFLVLLEEPE